MSIQVEHEGGGGRQDPGGSSGGITGGVVETEMGKRPVAGDPQRGKGGKGRKSGGGTDGQRVDI